MRTEVQNNRLANDHDLARSDQLAKMEWTDRSARSKDILGGSERD